MCKNDASNIQTLSFCFDSDGLVVEARLEFFNNATRGRDWAFAFEPIRCGNVQAAQLDAQSLAYLAAYYEQLTRDEALDEMRQIILETKRYEFDAQRNLALHRVLTHHPELDDQDLRECSTNGCRVYTPDVLLDDLGQCTHCQDESHELEAYLDLKDINPSRTRRIARDHLRRLWFELDADDFDAAVRRETYGVTMRLDERLGVTCYSCDVPLLAFIAIEGDDERYYCPECAKLRHIVEVL